MELECPQCSKRVQVSAEELALHDGAVVCPQCLAVFDASGEIPAGTVPLRSGRPVEEHLAYAYCPHCGRKIPQGVNFCPYCGQELAAVGRLADDETIPLAPEQADDTATSDADTDTSTHTHSSHHHSGSGHSSGSGRSSSGSGRSGRSRHSGSGSSKQWQPVMPSYRYAKVTGWRSGAQKAGTLFAIMAWMVIIALLALLAFIIHKVNLLM